MSLSEDFARNRRIFEMLTSDGAYREPEISDSNRTFEPFAHADPEPVFSDGKPLPTPEGPTPVKSYSLKYGARASTGIALSFEAPQSPEYPQHKSAVTASPADPLEPLYHRLEVEARLGSQLLGEEEF